MCFFYETGTKYKKMKPNCRQCTVFINLVITSLLSLDGFATNQGQKGTNSKKNSSLQNKINGLGWNCKICLG